MTRLLYVSAHDALEYDEVRMLRAAGHLVFPLGAHFPDETDRNQFRPALTADAAGSELHARFEADGCVFDPAAPRSSRLTRRFVERFDAVVVMHDLGFIERNWDVLSVAPVIWRSVGQAIEEAEPRVAALRRRGLKVLRWSPMEARAPGYAGEDAIIRAGKDPGLYGGWQGSDSDRIVTFSNAFAFRYPEEFLFYAHAIHGMHAVIGGANNPGVHNAIGVLDFDAQRALLRESGVYFYCHGSAIPYTLNFIEAWMTGIPVVALARDAEVPNLSLKYNEVASLIEHGSTGYLVRTVDQARSLLKRIIADPAERRAVSARARAKAIELFAEARTAQGWARFLGLLGSGPAVRAGQVAAREDLALTRA